MIATCKHPIVKVVAREDDVEFVECQQCREVFDSAEYNDIALEEKEALAEPASRDQTASRDQIASRGGVVRRPRP